MPNPEDEKLHALLESSGAQIKRLEKEVTEYINTEKVLIAAGLVTEDKVKQAHDIVQNFD